MYDSVVVNIAINYSRYTTRTTRGNLCKKRVDGNAEIRYSVCVPTDYINLRVLVLLSFVHVSLILRRDGFFRELQARDTASSDLAFIGF